jgi:hypothetical protein
MKAFRKPANDNRKVRWDVLVHLKKEIKTWYCYSDEGAQRWAEICRKEYPKAKIEIK